MAFQISQIIDTHLLDLATIVDKNNDGIISDGDEVSIFLKRAKVLNEYDLCDETEFGKLLQFCPREVSARGGKVEIGTQEYTPDEKAREEYLNQLNLEIDNELKQRNLERTPENISVVTEIIKKKKDLNIQIKIQEVKIEKLKQQKPRDKFETRKEIATATSMTAGALGGAWVGFKLGSSFGPIGMVTGAFIGSIVCSIVAGIGGLSIANATIPKDKLKVAESQIQEELNKEIEVLESLKKDLENC